jgi:hypothetical protein
MRCDEHDPRLDVARIARVWRSGAEGWEGESAGVFPNIWRALVGEAKSHALIRGIERENRQISRNASTKLTERTQSFGCRKGGLVRD